MAIGPGFKRAGMPHDKEMEMAALGCMLTGYPEAVSCVCEMLDLSCFYDPQHQAIFKAGASLYQRGAAVDILTVRDELEQINQLENRGKFRVMVGGAPVTQEFAQQIGADGFASDAASAAILAKAFIA